jgi:hypothetical protein
LNFYDVKQFFLPGRNFNEALQRLPTLIHVPTEPRIRRLRLICGRIQVPSPTSDGQGSADNSRLARTDRFLIPGRKTRKLALTLTEPSAVHVTSSPLKDSISP